MSVFDEKKKKKKEHKIPIITIIIIFFPHYLIYCQPISWQQIPTYYTTYIGLYFLLYPSVFVENSFPSNTKRKIHKFNTINYFPYNSTYNVNIYSPCT